MSEQGGGGALAELIALEEEEEGIHTLQISPEDYSESDYIPGAFLGM